VFFQGKLFQSSLMFVSMHLLLLTPGLNFKYKTRLKRTAWSKHSSLFCWSTSDKEKSFVTLAPGVQTVRAGVAADVVTEGSPRGHRWCQEGLWKSPERKGQSEKKREPLYYNRACV